MVEFKQFYTEREVSDKLAALIQIARPSNCLELSAGEGALIDAVLKKYPKVHVTAVDIDYKNASYLRGKYPDVNVLCGDSTLPELCDLINDSSFDIALCNPPFKSIVINSYISSLVFDMTGKKFKGDKVRAEIVFLLLNLKKLKSSGELAIILPDIFFSSLSYSWLREYLINNFSVSKIIECEHKAFKKTEAKTHIYHIRNVFSRKQSQIAFEKNGCEIYLSNMDFIFKNQFPDASEEFDDKFLLFRGKKSGKECRNSGLPYFHTTSFDSILTEKETNFNSYDGIALKNDILVARVGTRVLGKTVVFKGTSALVSDCIFCLRISDENLRDYFVDRWLDDKE
ncbi:N-6 DNA methylase, partial [Salmonella enterica]|nr:N-6 DNA methylase [Salmonella enterica subsp. enterica serovar Mbandaka]EEI9594880.1 N-6 DNA methylase [Salmonella enterica subsp. enterica serovar Mbandaka]